jgi:hypothetical protein
VHIGAARSLDRVRLGCVGRIIWRFTTVRVRPLSDVWIRRLIRRECVAAHIPVELLTSNWMKTVTRLAQGRPGVAVAIVQGASHMWMKAARLPAPAAAYLESYIQRAGERVGAQAESRA